MISERTITTSISPSTSTQTQIYTTVSPTLQTLAIHYLDVGQGDSILIDLGPEEVLIDGGDRSSGVVNYLQSLIDGDLEVMVATHTDADHIGGLIDVLSNYKVDEIWINGYVATSATYKEFMILVNAEGAIVHIAQLGDTIQSGNLDFKVLNPSLPLFTDANNNSIVLLFSYGNIDFLFMGDAEKEAEVRILTQNLILLPDIEILKVGHHASRTASSIQYLSAVKPDVAVYSCKIGNKYGHPHQETLTVLRDIGASIYGIDVFGTIFVNTDGKTFSVQTEKQASSALPSTTIPAPNTTLTPSLTPTSTSALITITTTNVQITRIFYDGVVPRTESDEYVEITNLGSEAVDFKGWVLKDISDGYPSFTFPSYILQPGISVRVYTNEIHTEYGGFSFGRGSAIWNNSDPDTAILFDAQGREVSRKSY